MPWGTMQAGRGVVQRAALAMLLTALVGVCCGPARRLAAAEPPASADRGALPLSNLVQCGWNRDAVHELHCELRAKRWRDVDQVFLVHGGRLVLHWGRPYAGVGRTRCDMADIVLSMLVGIAIERGDLRGTHQRLDEFLSAEELVYVQGAVTIEDVLTLRYHRLPEQSQAVELVPLLRWLDASSPTASGPLQTDLENSAGAKGPGVSVGNSADLSRDLSLRCMERVLERATDESIGVYAQRHLFRPLRILRLWTPDSESWGPRRHPLNLAPRDLAKLGLLYHNKGKWQGRQVVPRSWVAASLRSHVEFADAALGYRWCLKTLKVGDTPFEAFAAIGRFGHTMITVPEADLVAVVIDTRASEPPDAFELVEQHLLPNFPPVQEAIAASRRDGVD